MSPEGWITNLGAIAAALVGAYQAYGSKMEARRAKELSEPTGNGFASTTSQRLVRIEDKLDTHIHDHLTGELEREKREKREDDRRDHHHD